MLKFVIYTSQKHKVANLCDISRYKPEHPKLHFAPRPSLRTSIPDHNSDNFTNITAIMYKYSCRYRKILKHSKL